MAMKTLLVLLLCLMFVIGLVEARIPPVGGDMGPEISTPPSGSCGASIAIDDSSQQILAKRSPPFLPIRQLIIWKRKTNGF